MGTTLGNTKAPLFSRKQRGGAFTFIGEDMTTGNVFYVDSGQTATGGTTANYGRNPDAPFTTYAAALTNCTTNNGDMIVLMPGHAETTSAIAHSMAGVKVLGLGYGRNRPTITASTAASDLVDVTGANNVWENIIFTGAASGCTSLFSVSTADNLWKNCTFIHSADPLDLFVVTSGARNKWHDCTFIGEHADADNAILFAGTVDNACRDFEVINCVFNYGLLGIDEACISNVQTNSQITEGGIIFGNIFSGCVTTAVDFASSSSANIRGMCANNRATAFTGITVDAIYDAANYAQLKNKATDAVDTASPRNVPTATAD